LALEEKQQRRLGSARLGIARKAVRLSSSGLSRRFTMGKRLYRGLSVRASIAALLTLYKRLFYNENYGAAGVMRHAPVAHRGGTDCVFFAQHLPENRSWSP
jgi:hypothetical protein